MKIRYLRVWLATLLVVAAIFLVVSVCWAGHWELRYTPNAAISLTMLGEKIVGIVNPTFGPGRAGELELRLAGVPIMRLLAPPYEFVIDPDRPVEPLPGDEYKGFGAVKIREGLDYTIEAYVVEKGNRKRSAAPATTFRLERKSVTPAEQPSLSLTEEQLKSLLKQAYEEGYKRGAEQSPAPKVESESPKTTDSAPCPPKQARAIVRLWDEKGLPTTGTVLLRYKDGEQRVDVSGSAEINVPPGPVQILVPRSWKCKLFEGKSAVDLLPGEEVVWNLVKIKE